ncbi:MAG TPA: aromatic prenyltransferase [Micromonosporaceae bacterium]|nr:aromatic prenyltransferase [Micromonosporaceae bacterium]
MSGAAGVEDVYSAIEEAARLLDVACSRDKVWPVLTAYEDALAGAVVVFSMATGERSTGELDYTVTVPLEHGDPYARALSNGFVAETDHPVGALLSDVQGRCPIRGYAIDCGVVGGFKKTYAFFPLDNLQTLSTLADIPSMPRALVESAGPFARRGLDDKVTMMGIDYQHRTMNVYFGRFPAECLEPATVLSMLREIGLPEPDEQMLEFIRKSFSIYTTLSWDSLKVERICFAVITQDPMALPARIKPEIAKFAKSAPHAYAGERILVYGSTLSPNGEYYKLGSYYQMAPETWKLLQTSGAIQDRA